jgi:UDP-N-acetylmuramate dehydrogenase
MRIEKNVPLRHYTSFGVGGNAENFAEVKSTDELIELLSTTTVLPITLLGYGSNTLISDQTIPGLTICIKGGAINILGTSVTVDAGVWWDDVVQASIEKGLWGAELMSEIPGSVGAATYINITAYGQTIGPLIDWVDVWNPESEHVERINRGDLVWDYKKSIFQNKENSKLIILRVSLHLSESKTDELVYQKALDVAEELHIEPNTLTNRRKIITEARKQAGSLWHPDEHSVAKTAGSFFRNPVVSEEMAESIMAYDESGKTSEQIKLMNKVHGGDTKRVSAAHVMLACGFRRGQQWGNVKLNDQNLLKIEALPGATAQEIFDTAMLIQKTCQKKLGILLEPEARIIGAFSQP